MNGKTGLRIVSALVLIAAIAGITFLAFQAGITQGSPITIEGPTGQIAPMPYPHYGYGFHRPFGFGFLGLLFWLFFFFIALRAFRFLLWGPRWGHMGHHGPWRHGWGENGVPPMFEEWHKRAHRETTEDKKE